MASREQIVLWEAALIMTARHIRQGEQHIADQELRVTEAMVSGRSLEEAEDLLRQFRASLIEHQAHYDRVAAELGKR